MPQPSLFFFAADGTGAAPNKYRLLIESAKFADEAGFAAVWVPERHFQRFGGLYGSPAVAATAVAVVTRRIQVRAGSVVLPLQNPLRVAEEWSMIDNLSGGRVGMAVASGWHVDDFVLNPTGYANRGPDLGEKIEIVRRLWRGERITLPNGAGNPVEVGILPRPLQPELPVWFTAHSDEGIARAAQFGFNVLTANFKQKDQAHDLERRIASYRATMQKLHGRPGIVTLMSHTFVGSETAIQEIARPAMRAFLAANIEMKSGEDKKFHDVDTRRKESVIDLRTNANMDGALSFIGTPDKLREKAAAWDRMGIDEIACLIDFGVPFEATMASLRELAQMRLAR